MRCKLSFYAMPKLSIEPYFVLIILIINETKTLSAPNFAFTF